MDATVSLNSIFWLAAGIGSIVVIVKIIKIPFNKLEDHEVRIADLEKEHKNREEMNRYTIKALNAIVNHMIDGNGIDKLKEVRDEYQNKIIEFK